MALQTSVRRGLIAIVIIGVALLALPARSIFLMSRADRAAVPPALQPALSGLQSPSAFERASAVKALHLSHNPAVAHVLIEKLDDADQAVGLYVAQALGELTPKSDLPQLRQALTSGNPDVRWRAALALGELKDPAAVPGLVKLLSDSDTMAQRAAAEGLGKIGGKAATAALVDAMGSDQESTVQAAMAALESMGNNAVPALSNALTARQTKVRLNAAIVLGYIASPQARPALQLASIDQEAEVRAAVQRALSQIQD